MTRGKKWVAVLFALVLVSGAAMAQTETETPGEPARARLGQFAADAPELELYIDGELFVAPDGTANIPPGSLSNFVPFPAGSYRVALAPIGSDVENAVVGPETLMLEAGHVYTVAIVGQYADEDLHLLVIDETAAFPDVGNISSRILIHNLKGAPNLDMIVDGQIVISDLAYGEVATAEQPTGVVENIQFTAAGEPENVIFEDGLPVFHTGTTYLLALVGSYPGEEFSDYFPVPAIVYMGDLTISDGGAIVPGNEVTGELAAAGERETYSLQLDEDATVDVILSAAADSPLDAYIRLYDADGNLLAENDELDFEDESADAGLLGHDLTAGSYTIEVASWGDAFPGQFTLSVQASE